MGEVGGLSFVSYFSLGFATTFSLEIPTSNRSREHRLTLISSANSQHGIVSVILYIQVIHSLISMFIKCLRTQVPSYRRKYYAECPTYLL